MSWTEFLEYFNKPFLEMAGFQLSLALIAKAILLPIFVIWLSRVIRNLVNKTLSKLSYLDQGSRNAISTVVYYVVLGLGLGWVLTTLGLNATSIAVFTGALGLGIGLGFQDVAKNFISGIIMLIARTVKPGDVITVGDLTGRVENVGMYSSTMKTVYDATVIIPNSQILSDKFVNWTHDAELRMIEIPVGVHYDSDLDVVMECMQQASKAVSDIKETPEPRILLLNYGTQALILLPAFGLLR